MASATVLADWKAWLAANFTACPVIYENEPATLPEPPSAWIFVELMGRLYSQESIGAGPPAANWWRESGDTYLHVWVPSNSGSAVARGHAETLAMALRGAILGVDTKIKDMYIGDGGNSDDGAWWRITLRVEWERG